MKDAKRTNAPLLYAAALIGALFAALADLTQKSDASAVKAITQAFRETLLLDTAPWVALLCLVLLGVASCFVFEPKTKPSAFNRGLGVIALLATAVPYKAPPGLQSEANAPSRNALSFFALVMAAPPEQETAARQRGEVEVRLIPREGEVHRSTITLLDPSTKKILAQSVTASGTVLFARSPGTYELEVVADGYQAVKDTVVVKEGSTTIEVPLEPVKFGLFEQLLPSKATDFTVKTLPPSTPQTPSTLAVKNTSRRLNPTEWGWTIFVDGPEELLARIDCVEYTLHPTFRDPVQKVCERGQGEQAFPLSARGWGTFQVGVRIFLTDGSTQNLTHQLEFE